MVVLKDWIRNKQQTGSVKTTQCSLWLLGRVEPTHSFFFYLFVMLAWSLQPAARREFPVFSAQLLPLLPVIAVACKRERDVLVTVKLEMQRYQ